MPLLRKQAFSAARTIPMSSDLNPLHSCRLILLLFPTEKHTECHSSLLFLLPSEISAKRLHGEWCGADVETSPKRPTCWPRTHTQTRKNYDDRPGPPTDRPLPRRLNPRRPACQTHRRVSATRHPVSTVAAAAADLPSSSVPPS